jgi:hypothetical protein
MSGIDAKYRDSKSPDPLIGVLFRDEPNDEDDEEEEDEDEDEDDGKEDGDNDDGYSE